MRNAAEMIELTKSAREPVHRVGWGTGGNQRGLKYAMPRLVWSYGIKSVKVYRQFTDLKLPGGIVI